MTAIDERPVATAAELRHQQTVRAHRVLGQLIERVPLDFPMWRWSVSTGITSAVDLTIGVEVNLNVMPNGHASRAAMMGLAEQFGLDYTEKSFTSDKNAITALGHIDEVPVKFFDLVAPCDCGNCGGAR